MKEQIIPVIYAIILQRHRLALRVTSDTSIPRKDIRVICVHILHLMRVI